MLETPNELEWALDQIERFESALGALREQLADTNPALYAVTSKAYEQRIRSLRDDVIAFLRERPAGAPLRVVARGASVGHGVIPAKLAAQLLNGLRSTLLAVGQQLRDRQLVPPDVKLREVFDLNLVATAMGSFVFSLDLAPATQPTLFSEYHFGELGLEELAGYVNALDPATGGGADVPPSVLSGLSKLSEVLSEGVQEVEISYSGPTRSFSARLGQESRDTIRARLGGEDLGPQTVKGVLVAIDIEKKQCSIQTGKSRRVNCAYDDRLEDRLIRALKRRVEIAGPTESTRAGRAFHITRIERFRQIAQTEGGQDESPDPDEE
jgi:hypothetical protein